MVLGLLGVVSSRIWVVRSFLCHSATLFRQFLDLCRHGSALCHSAARERATGGVRAMGSGSESIMIPSQLRRRLLPALVALGCAVSGLGASESAAAAPVPSAFTVYDNAAYPNVDLEHLGAVRSNIVYEAPVARLASQQPRDFRGPRPYWAELALPPRAAYEALVRNTVRYRGPVVLDFETLYLRGSTATAYRRFQKLQTLLAWTHEAVPGRTVGYYGVLGNTAPRYLGLERRLAAHEDALFPSLYTFSDNLPAWHWRFRQIMAEAAYIAPGKPVYAYLRPQYHEGTRLAGRYLTPDHWSYELRVARRLCSGVVIWGPRHSDPDQRWVEATGSFLGAPFAA
jgi:hypothetical protein